MNNTPRQWGIIVGLLLFLYFCLGLMFYALMEIALDTRNNDYMTLPDKYYGDFEKEKQPGSVAGQGGWSRPKGCDYKTNECKDNTLYSVYPWTRATTPECKEGQTFTVRGKCASP